MKCPYNVSKKTTSQATSTQDEAMLNSGAFSTVIEELEFKECYKDECAAWIDGHCSFNAERIDT